MSRVLRRPSANRDLVAIYHYYAREAGIRVADRFFAEAQATFGRLATMPRIGTVYDADERLFADVRHFPVSRFRDHLVFYRPMSDGIEVFRVLHGARDIQAILSDEFRSGDDEEPDESISKDDE